MARKRTTTTTTAAKSTAAKATPQKIKRGARLTGDTRSTVAAQMREQYDSGMSIRDIAREHGRSYGGTHKLLTQAGVELRGRGGAHGTATS